MTATERATLRREVLTYLALKVFPRERRQAEVWGDMSISVRYHYRQNKTEVHDQFPELIEMGDEWLFDKRDLYSESLRVDIRERLVELGHTVVDIPGAPGVYLAENSTEEADLYRVRQDNMLRGRTNAATQRNLALLRRLPDQEGKLYGYRAVRLFGQSAEDGEPLIN